MKVRIKREQVMGFLAGRAIFLPKGISLKDFSFDNLFPGEMEFEISESDIVKEKSNCEKWEEIFMKIGDMETIEMIEGWSKDKADLFDLNGIDATQAYEKIVEGK